MTATAEKATDQVRVRKSTRRLAKKEAADEGVTLADIFDKAMVAYSKGKKTK